MEMSPGNVSWKCLCLQAVQAPWQGRGGSAGPAPPAMAPQPQGSAGQARSPRRGRTGRAASTFHGPLGFAELCGSREASSRASLESSAVGDAVGEFQGTSGLQDGKSFKTAIDPSI